MLTRNSVSQTPHRRSARLLNKKAPIKPQDFNTPISEKPITSSNGSTSGENPKPVLRRSPRFSSASSKLSENFLNSMSGLRRSPRLNSVSLSNKPEEISFSGTKKAESRKKKSAEEELVGEEKREIIVGLKAVSVEGGENERNEDFGVKRKGKPDVEADGNVRGWTREQELILQKAYLSAKPTPNFWKKVSKLVPGKSAQDCFDKIHSDHLTPTQPQPRSRSKRKDLSLIEHLSFSASKLLKPVSPKNKRSRSSKHKSLLVQKKTVRHLLQKQCYEGHGDEADLFSILESNTSSSMHAPPNNAFSTPTKLLAKQGLLQKCHERSSSSKKPHSKLGNTSKEALISPPVLKQIKNRGLHEKYIDQLHCREAKRKAESAQAGKDLGKENLGSRIHGIDKVRVAKNKLVSDTRDVINQLQNQQTTSVDDSLDLDNDGVDSGDDQGDLQL
ncbi:DNA binding protein, putative isoform 1 [Hibiscus syriacus]|uniref:DNA binding protein, putative isoform 1 n=2 Tax=Hibiscus syriacus TaxID=106335 RepID=A0A6A3AYS5_HIBSY|nr:DNA binding protein, putative isoform 1 [Hibiscus syriacus]